MTKKTAIAVILLLLVFAALAERLGGYVLLEGETDHSGTKIKLEESGIPYIDSAFTDSVGKFMLDDVPLFTFMSMTISHPGFETFSSLCLFTRSDSTDTIMILSKNTVVISGIVTLEGETDYSGTIVTELGSATIDTTDSTGAYALTDVPKGMVRITAAHDGFYSDTTRYITLDHDTSGVDFHLLPLPPSGSISGTVILVGESNHIGTTVTETRSGISDVTDSTGAYTLSGVPLDTVEVVAVHTGFIPDTTSFTLSADTTGVDFLLLPILYTVDGIITLQESTNHSGTQIVLSNGTTYDDTVVTDSTGSFAFDDVPAGSFTFTATHDGFDIFDTTLSVSSDITINRQLFTGIAEGKPSLPGVMTLYGNIPNPFNATTDIVFELYRPDNIELTIFDIMGREVTTLVSGPMDRGLHRISWDGSDATGRTMGSGVYLCRMTTAKGRITDRMILIK